jgi:glucosamine--fructose-6-phosphate aminotransferase (isomerizing)
MQLQKGGIFAEITDQPRAWKETLQMLIRRKDELSGWLKGENFGQVLFVGSGSSYAVAMSAASITQLVSGLNTVALSSSEILYLRRPPYDSRIKTLVVALSRTGTSSDTQWAVEKIKKLHATCKVLMIGAQEGTLGALADQKIILPRGLEECPIGVRTPSCMLLATMVSTAWLSGKDVFINELVKVPELFDDPNYIKAIQDLTRKLSAPKPIPIHFTFLGSGPYYGLAYEGARKIRELAAIPAEFQTAMEYRHASFTGLSKDHMVVALISDTLRKGELDVLSGLAKTRAQRIAVMETADEYAKMRTDSIIELKSKVSEISRVLAMYPVVQLLCFYMCIAKGKNPDRLMHLEPPIIIKDRPGV